MEDRIIGISKEINSSISIQGLEPLPKLHNVSTQGVNYYGEEVTTGVRPANDREIMDKVNEVVDKLNLLLSVIENHIIGGR